MDNTELVLDPTTEEILHTVKRIRRRSRKSAQSLEGLSGELVRLDIENDVLRTALLAYAHHLEGCQGNSEHEGCTCGLKDALESL